LKLLALLDEPAVLVVPLAAAPPLVVVVVFVVVLLLPHAASPRAHTIRASAPRPDGLILPDTTNSFPQLRSGNHNRVGGPVASRLTWL
jgi:hypothetical protein